MTSPAQDQFNTDFQKLIDAANQYQQAEAEMKQAEDYYKSVVMQKLNAAQSVDQIMYLLETLVFQSSGSPADPNADGCLFGIYGDQAAQYGQGINVSGILTQVHNDISKLVTSGSSDPATVKDVADDLDKVLDQLKNNPALKDALGLSLSDIQTTDTALRDQFYVKGDDAYNPTYNPDPTTNGYTYHFVYDPSVDPKNDPNYTYTFADMEARMKLPSDQAQATEGFDSLTKSFSADGNDTNTLNSAINVQLNNLLKFVQTLQGFYENGILQPQMKLSNVAIQNMSKS